VVVTALWVVLLAAAVVWEVVCRCSGGRWTSLGELAGAMGARWPGLVILLVLWAFVGWHVFSRYTLPH
jgi:TRAP-type C4-dicarboxylate transport system permease small subunit